MKIRILSIMLTLCMVLASMPAIVFAEGETAPGPVSVLTPAETETESLTEEEEQAEGDVESEAGSLSAFPLESLS